MNNWNIYIYININIYIYKLPTPVSSLLHAACLVIAGVYLLIRCSFIIEYSPIILIIILISGGISTLVSGLMAVAANDVKRIVALSTMS